MLFRTHIIRGTWRLSFTEDLKLNDHYSIYLLQKNGEIDFLKIIIKSIDIGLPELLFSPTGLVLLQPEGQKVQIISFRNGTGIEYSLFNKSSWSHEKNYYTVRIIQEIFICWE